MKWARVDEDGVIREFTFTNPVGRFHPSLVWIEVDDPVQMYSTVTLNGIEPPLPVPEVDRANAYSKDPNDPPPPEQMPEPAADAKEETDVPTPPAGFTVQVTPE